MDPGLGPKSIFWERFWSQVYTLDLHDTSGNAKVIWGAEVEGCKEFRFWAIVGAKGFGLFYSGYGGLRLARALGAKAYKECNVQGLGLKGSNMSYSLRSCSFTNTPS